MSLSNCPKSFHLDHFYLNTRKHLHLQYKWPTLPNSVPNLAPKDTRQIQRNTKAEKTDGWGKVGDRGWVQMDKETTRCGTKGQTPNAQVRPLCGLCPHLPLSSTCQSKVLSFHPHTRIVFCKSRNGWWRDTCSQVREAGFF